MGQQTYNCEIKIIFILTRLSSRIFHRMVRQTVFRNVIHARVFYSYIFLPFFFFFLLSFARNYRVFDDIGNELTSKNARNPQRTTIGKRDLARIVSVFTIEFTASYQIFPVTRVAHGHARSGYNIRLL